MFSEQIYTGFVKGIATKNREILNFFQKFEILFRGKILTIPLTEFEIMVHSANPQLQMYHI